MSYIKIENLSWKYNSSRDYTIKNIDLEIEQGDFVGVLGATGSGRTSLALILRGLIPDFFDNGDLIGRCVIDGLEVTASSPNLFADKVGLSFQDSTSQVLGTTVYEDMIFGLSNLGLDKEYVLKQSEKYLKDFLLWDKKERNPNSLSGGELQRLVSSSVLAMEPNVIILDEPAAELDPIGKTDLGNSLEKIRENYNKTVILIEQDAELIAQFCNKILIMKDGEIVFFGKTEDAYKDLKMFYDAGVYPPEIVVLYDTLRKKFNLTKDSIATTSKELYKALEKPLGFVPYDEIDENFNMELEKNKANQKQKILSNNLFVFDNVVHTYETPTGPFNALDGINLHINKGDFISLIGTNGAGKSTFTKHINNILKPTHGNVLYKNENIKNKGTEEFLGLVGYCFQNPDHQIFSDNIYDELAYGLRNMGYDEEIIKYEVEKVAKVFRLQGRLEENPFNLGKGERQKIALASTIIMKPEFLVIDEPTTGLDWLESKEILNLIEQLHKDGMTILAVTHDMKIVREYSNRVVAMDKGKIIFDGEVSGLYNSPKLFEEANITVPPILHFYTLLTRNKSKYKGKTIRTIYDIANLLGADGNEE